MKQLLIVLLMLVGLSCCDNDEEFFPVCEFTDPLEDLAWLKEYKESLGDCQVETSIFQANYKKHIVFYSAITDPLVNSVFGITLWDCEGKIVHIFDYDEAEKFYELVSNRAVLYRCKEDPEGL